MVFATQGNPQFEVLNGPTPGDLSLVPRTSDGRYEIHDPYIALQWLAGMPYSEALTPVFTHFCVQPISSRNLTVKTLVTENMVTDYETLSVSGTLIAQIENTGSLKVDQSFKVLFYEDLDGNHDFTTGDLILAEATQSELLAGTTATITAPASGRLAFAGDLIHVYVDYTNVVIETDETDNLLYVKCADPVSDPPTETPAP